MGAQVKRAPPEDGGSGQTKSSDNGGINGKRHKKEPLVCGQSNASCCSEAPCLDSSVLSQPPWVHVLMLACCIVTMAYCFGSSPSFESDSVVVMARQDEVIEGKRYRRMDCTDLFRQEIRDLDNEKCLPSKCGRVVFDNVISNRSAHRLLEMAKKGFALGGASGPMSILDLHSGALSRGEQFVNWQKVQPDLFDEEDFKVYRKVTDDVRLAVADHFQVSPEHLYMSNPTNLHRIVYQEDGISYWNVHVDKDDYPSFHYNALLYLSDFGHDFQGGRFIFTDEDDKTNRTVEPRLGRLSAFTPSEENRHYVERMTEGTRYLLQMGFSCDKSKEVSTAGSHLE